MTAAPASDRGAADRGGADRAGADRAGAEHVVTNGLVRDWSLPTASDDGDKHSRGTILVVAGAVRTPGAAMLAGVAALRAGAGRLQIATTASTAVALGVSVPEALVAGLAQTAEGGIDPSAADEILSMARGADAILLGPGLMDRTAVRQLTARVLGGLDDDGPVVVLDAAVLSSIDAAADPLGKLGGRVLLTPNEGELATLADGVAPDADGILDVRAAATSVARDLGAVVVVRGWIVSPEGECWRHEAGTSGLGTSGSGDVKSGIVAGIAARGAAAAQAGVWGAHVHARAGERLVTRVGLGFLARELLEEIPAAMAEISS